MQRREQQIIITAATGTAGLILILTVGWLYFKPFQTTRYKSTLYGFSLKYPPRWSMTENVQGAAVVFSSPPDNALDRFQENINIVVQDISKNPMTLDVYSKSAIEQMQSVFGTNLEILESSPTFLAGRDGYRFVFIGKGKDVKLQYMCVWTLKGTTAYQLTYTAMAEDYETHIEEAKRIISSFHIQ